MKQDVYEILLYLFDHFVVEDGVQEYDRESLSDELQAAGFPPYGISRAFEWLDGLHELPDAEGLQAAVPLRSIRIYAADECERLDIESRGFLLFLEQMGILNNVTRELVIDRMMALDSDDADLDQLKWVVLMVLFNQPGQEAAASWMEDVVIDQMELQLH